MSNIAAPAIADRRPTRLDTDPSPRNHAPRMSDEPSIIARALALLRKRNLVLSLQDPSFPGAPGEDIGRGSPYTRGGRDFIARVAALGFTGLQLGPQGQTSPDNQSP